MAWRKRIIQRKAEWTGINGRHFDTVAYIDLVFYSNPKTEKPYYIKEASGALIGGSTSSVDDCVRFINGLLKKGSPRTTREEIINATQKARKEMIQGQHKWNMPEYPDRDEWYNYQDYEDD